MIPKIIHYCWFGGSSLPESARKCIASWKTYFPDYEIREWNETNFDISCCAYVKEAYEAGKWAFVSDYARFWILYHHGGLYFDTDVEVIRSFNTVLSRGSFMGCEFLLNHDCSVGINPGLGMGAEPSMPLYNEILDFYNQIHFRKDNGELDKSTVVDNTTAIFVKHGWLSNNIEQTISDIIVYPTDYFCPMNYATGVITLTNHTLSIHHYTASWLTRTDIHINQISRFFVKYFGTVLGQRIARIIDFPLRVKNKFFTLGFCGTINFCVKKFLDR